MLRLRSLIPLAVAAALATGSLSAASTQVFPLGRGGVERVLAKDTVHAYPVDLRVGEYLSLRVDQRGVDIELRLFDPGGHLLLRLDSPNGAHGPEDLFFFAEKGGRYRLEIGLRSGPPGGRYQIGVRARRPATARDRRRAAALLAFSRAAELERAHATEQSAAEYQRSAVLWRGLHEEGRRAEALRCAGDLRFAAGDPQDAVKTYQEALLGYRAAGDRWNQVVIDSRMADCYRDLGELAEARAWGERALTKWRQLGAKQPIATALHSLGEVSRQQGDLRAAIGFFQEESEKADTSEVRARALVALAVALAAVGDGTTAQAKCQQALTLLQEPGESAVRAQALTQLANVFFDAGSPSSARLALRRAWLVLRKSAAMNRHDMAITLASMGRAYFMLGDLRQAKDYHQKALELLAETRGSLDEGYIWNNLGWIEGSLRKPQQAFDAFQHGLSMARARGSRELEAAVLLGMALVERQRNNSITARARIEEALDLVEAMRDRLVQPDLQISFLAKKEDYYRFTIDLLMGQRPKSDAAQRAFAISERSRSRSLLDRLSKAGNDAGMSPLSMADVQHDLLDDDTLLLEYYLSEPKSYLWVVSAKATASFELAGQSVLEGQARQTLAALARRTSSPVIVRARLAELGNSLLAPAAGWLGNKRLLFAPHGALQSLPFAALSEPSAVGGWSPLLLRHEVVVLPSASVLAALRQRAAGRKTSTGKVALIGDPVISWDDPRLTRLGQRAPGPLEGGALDLLRYAKQETDAIARLVPPRNLLKLEGFAASRDQVIGDRLTGYGTIHFATHALFDEDNPDRSAIVLSRFDAAGGLHKGLLRVQDIESMRLRADLVVLSACETARGREVRGEGVVGLTRSFLGAGADRVMVSLWKVDDRATAVLMERFYQKLLTEGRSPAAALRAAQLSMLQEERWHHPYQWAGFLIQGGWD